MTKKRKCWCELGDDCVCKLGYLRQDLKPNLKGALTFLHGIHVTLRDAGLKVGIYFHYGHTFKRGAQHLWGPRVGSYNRRHPRLSAAYMRKDWRNHDKPERIKLRLTWSTKSTGDAYMNRQYQPAPVSVEEATISLPHRTMSTLVSKAHQAASEQSVLSDARQLAEARAKERAKYALEANLRLGCKLDEDEDLDDEGVLVTIDGREWTDTQPGSINDYYELDVKVPPLKYKTPPRAEKAARRLAGLLMGLARTDDSAALTPSERGEDE